MKKRLLILVILCLFIFTFFVGGVYAKNDKIIGLMRYILQKIEINQAQPEQTPVKPINISITINTEEAEDAKTENDEIAENTDMQKNEVKKSTKSTEVKEEEIEKPDKKKSPNPLKGIYLTVDTMNGKRGMELVDELLKNGGNAVVIDIEHGGGLLAFKPKNEFLKSLNPGSGTLDDLPEIIDELHEKGIYVIARQVVFNDPYIGSRKPEWRIKNKWGGLYDYRWLDPSIPGVHLYNIYIMQEAAEMGFDEIQFDYIRFPAAYHENLDYNYNEEEFTRVDVIIEFLMKARQVADNYGIQISADVFGAIVWGDVDWRNVGQNASEIAKYVDAIYPMTYPSHVNPGYNGHMNPWGQPYSFINNSIKRFVEAAAGKAEIRTWVQGFPLKIPNFGTWFMEEQIKASFDAGATGYTIWSPGNHYTYSWPALKLNPEEEDIASLNTDITNTAQ